MVVRVGWGKPRVTVRMVLVTVGVLLVVYWVMAVRTKAVLGLRVDPVR